MLLVLIEGEIAKKNFLLNCLGRYFCAASSKKIHFVTMSHVLRHACAEFALC